jgi:hypothetical protein
MITPIPSVVLNYFAARPDGPIWNLERVIVDAPPALLRDVNSFLEAIPKDEVLAVQKDDLFQHLCGTGDTERAARIWIAERHLSKEIARQKLLIIRSDVHNPRPAPYDLPALAELPVDSDHLIPLSAFKFDGSRLLHNGYAFSALTTTPLPNSSYWLLAMLFSEGLSNQVSIRLDPFLCGPENTFPAMSYKMWQYGRTLDWRRMAALREVDHGRWLPGTLSRESLFTDFCWSPRDDGIHFLCEEVPKEDSCDNEPSRYLHAIYNPNSEKIEHFDGALRVFTIDEMTKRKDVHVRNGGKLGVREKVFRINRPISRDRFSAVTQAFYVWNEDIQRYFTQELALS